MTTYDHAHEQSLFLSSAQRELLAAVVDRIIPPGDGVPGAGEVGVAEHVEGICSVSPKTRALLTNGLKAIEAASGHAHSKEFGCLSEGERTAILKRVESERVEFFAALVRETYSGYYSSPESFARRDCLSLLHSPWATKSSRSMPPSWKASAGAARPTATPEALSTPRRSMGSRVFTRACRAAIYLDIPLAEALR